MAYIISGVILILLLMTDIVRTTLTTRGEGLISAFVSGAFRKVACSSIRAGHRPSEIIGSISISTLALVWLAGLWAGWVLVFMGIPDAIAHSGDMSGVDLHDVIYFVGFTLSTLGTGDLFPTTRGAQIATVLSSFSGLLIVTLIVTYAVSVVSAVVARRVLAYKIYLNGGNEGEFLSEFPDIENFAAWVAGIKNELVSCTEQRLAYPVLDNFVSRDERFSLPVQLARLGLVTFQGES
ncbi:ion channel [Marinobacter orientalis]|uniref:Two pore domain potassium channel family protein n=1 Tax=Marinobacter orientalis TaxID=1928859 RepID=A0A7Y0WRT4_9GAMM|nr:ion channel [Marinobacter orientalis]NMT63207.1 two pore domain potassium channel family protein [Marinobacter orientalis]TGX51861.1 two pore domain potassium channel family protein [Marinobacter orientalis]